MRRSYSGASSVSDVEENEVVDVKSESTEAEKIDTVSSESADSVEKKVEEPEQKEEEPSIYQELADKFGVSFGEMEVIAEYLRFAENKGDRMRAYSTFTMGGLLVSVFSLAALIMLIAGKLPERFSSWTTGLILVGILAVAVLVVVVCFKKSVKTSKLEGFRDIEFIAPMTLIDKRQRENLPDQYCVQLNETRETCWCNAPLAYRTKIDVNGKPYKIKVNTHLKVGSSGYYVSYIDRFGHKTGNFLLLA